jgi:hypothetical protein
VERIAKLCRSEQAQSKKRRFEELSSDKELPVVDLSTVEIHKGNAKRRGLEGKEPVPSGGNLNEGLNLSEQSAQAFQARTSSSGLSSSGNSGAVRELGSHSKRERIAAGIALARTILSHVAQKIELEPKDDGSIFTQNQRPDASELVQKERKTPPSGRGGGSLGKEKGLATTEESDRASATETQMSVILPSNNARPKSNPSSHLPWLLQNTRSSQKDTAKPFDLFLTTVTEAWSGVFFQTQRHNIYTELQAHQGYIWEILSRCKDSDVLSKGAQTTVLNRVTTQMLLEFEKTWAGCHPEVKVPAIENILDRQIAYLTLDVALKCGDVAHLDDADLMKHITAVQSEAMSRQLTILRAFTESLRQKAQRMKPAVARFQDQHTTLASSIILPSKQVSSIRVDSSKPGVQIPGLVIDEVTGVASVVQAVDSGKGIDTRSSRGKQKKSLKRRQEAEASTSRKRPKTINAQEDDAVVAMQEQTTILQSLAPNAATYRRSHMTRSNVENQALSDVENLFTKVGAGIESNGTVSPAELLKSYSVSSNKSADSQPIRNTPAPNKRGFMDVTEAFKAHDYNIVLEEDRTRNLLLHRQANRALLGEVGPVDAGIGSAGVDGFFYGTPVEFDSFGYEDELEVAEDETRGFDLDSEGLWKW